MQWGIQKCLPTCSQYLIRTWKFQSKAILYQSKNCNKGLKVWTNLNEFAKMSAISAKTRLMGRDFRGQLSTEKCFFAFIDFAKILSVWWSTHSDATMTRQVIGEPRAENINVVILQVTIALCPLTSQSMSKKLLYCFQKLSIKKSRRQMKTREILFLNS